MPPLPHCPEESWEAMECLLIRSKEQWEQDRQHVMCQWKGHRIVGQLNNRSQTLIWIGEVVEILETECGCSTSNRGADQRLNLAGELQLAITILDRCNNCHKHTRALQHITAVPVFITECVLSVQAPRGRGSGIQSYTGHGLRCPSNCFEMDRKHHGGDHSHGDAWLQPKATSSK